MPQPRRFRLALYALLGIAVFVLGVRYLDRQRVPTESAPAPEIGPAAAPGVRIERPRARTALVHVVGAVRRPGVYRLREGQRVQDALTRAGGPRAQADLAAINLAGQVNDGQQIVVPRRGRAGSPATAGATGAGGAALAGQSAPVNLNTATAEQLETLDGVGPATAQKIIAWREQHGGFRSIDDLEQVPGIGPKRMAALRDRVQT